MIHRPGFSLCLLPLLLLASVTAFAQRPELVMQTGHPGGPTAVAFSPDTRLAVTGGSDNTVKLWDMGTGRELRTLRGFSRPADRVAFSVDGRAMMAASDDGTLRVWDVTTGRELSSMSFPTLKSVFGMAFSPDRKIFASGGDDMTVSLWEVATGRQLRVLSGSGMKIYALAFSPDGKRIVGGGYGGTIRLWDAVTGAPLPSPVAPAGIVYALAFSPDGKLIASGGADKTVKLGDAKTGALRHTLSGHTESVKVVAFSPDGKTLASASSDKTVRLWEVATGKLLRVLSGGQPVAFSPDGRALAVGVGDDVRLLDASTGGELGALRGHTSFAYFVAFSPDGKMLAQSAAGRPNYVKLWNVGAGRELSTLKAENNLGSLALAFSPDSRLLAMPSAFNAMRLWETRAGKERLTWGKEYTLDYSAVAFTPDGRYVVTGSNNGRVVYWEPATGKPVGLLKTDAMIHKMALSPDGGLVAIADFEKGLAVWDVSASRRRFDLRGHMKMVNSVAFSPDGRTLASASADQTIRLWDVATGAELRALRGHADEVFSIAFSPDGRTLASGSRDKTVRFWDAATGRERHTLTGSSGDLVLSVAFSPDGRLVASAGFDSGVKLWDVASGQELARLIAIDEKDWLVVTPDGLFDGSAAAWGLVLWRFGQNNFDVLPAEAFFNEFYRPGLLSEIFSGQRPVAQQNIADKDRRQPTLKLMLADAQSATKDIDSRSVQVEIEVVEAVPDTKRPNSGSGAQDLRLFRNGSLVKVWHGDAFALTEKDGCRRPARGKVTCHATIPIIAGDNQLMAYAFNHDNIKSADATLIVGGAERLRRKGTAYVVAVGVNRYAPNPFFRNLRFAVADAEEFAAEVARQQEGLKRYETVQVARLIDEAATKANVLSGLAQLSAKIQPEDVVIVYFAGHGLAAGGKFYLIPHDIGAAARAEQTGAQVVLDALLAAHGISDRELADAFAGIDAGQLMLVIDACNSGQALGGEREGRGPMNSKGLAQLAYEKGMYILTAAQSYQAAQEAARLGHGFLTYALVEEGLKKAAADKEPEDGQVLIREWLDYATERVPQMQEEKMIEQLRGRGLNIAFVEGEERVAEPEKRSVQRPRVFYRRELEAQPLIVARPGASQ